jgi:hypothetical protein
MITLVVSRKVGADDISFGTGSLVYTDANGVTHTIAQVNISNLPFLTDPNLNPDNLIDGSYVVNIKPLDINAAGDITGAGDLIMTPMNVAGFVKNTAAGLFSGGNALAAADLTAGIMPTGIDAAKLADGSVSNAEFQFINSLASNVQDQINGIIAGASTQPSFALLQNRQAQNTSGGTATTGAWNIIPLNTEQEDFYGIVDSSVLPAFTLAAGTYRFEGYSPFYNCNGAQSRLYNITTPGVSIIGTSVKTGSTSNDQVISTLIGTLTVAAPTQFRLEYRVNSTKATNGLGVAMNFGAEVYAQLMIWKIA